VLGPFQGVLHREAYNRTVFLTFATDYNILNLWRAVGTGYDVQLHGDVTGKASTLALSKRLSDTCPSHCCEQRLTQKHFDDPNKN
jgi:hypothetical protein